MFQITLCILVTHKISLGDSFLGLNGRYNIGFSEHVKYRWTAAHHRCINLFNAADSIPKAIRNAQEQTYNNIEILIVDDGSMDHSVDVCWLKLDLTRKKTSLFPM